MYRYMYGFHSTAIIYRLASLRLGANGHFADRWDPVSKQVVAAAVAEEFVVADACRKQIVNIISAIAESGQVCTGCFIAIPSSQARQSLRENGMATGNLFVASAI